MTAQARSPTDSLELRLIAPASARSGQSLRFVVRATNVTDRTLDLFLTGRVLTFDIVLSDAGGREVWSRLHGQTVPAILRVERLGPRQTIEMEADWNGLGNNGGPLPPGTYGAEALLPGDAPGPWRSARVTIRIEPRAGGGV